MKFLLELRLWFHSYLITDVPISSRLMQFQILLYRYKIKPKVNQNAIISPLEIGQTLELFFNMISVDKYKMKLFWILKYIKVGRLFFKRGWFLVSIVKKIIWGLWCLMRDETIKKYLKCCFLCKSIRYAMQISQVFFSYLMRWKKPKQYICVDIVI